MVRDVTELSHTATEGWQSFELRMRQRRIARCLACAAAALDGGAIDDARAAIDEVRALDPAHPALAQLAARVGPGLRPASPQPAVPRTGVPAVHAEELRKSRPVLLPLAASVAIVLAGAGGWVAVRIGSQLKSDVQSPRSAGGPPPAGGLSRDLAPAPSPVEVAKRRAESSTTPNVERETPRPEARLPETPPPEARAQEPERDVRDRVAAEIAAVDRNISQPEQSRDASDSAV